MIFSQILPFSDADLFTEVTLDDGEVITNTSCVPVANGLIAFQGLRS